MNELSERARELATKYMGANCMEHCWCQYSEKNADDYVSCEDKLVGLIEQALLAERRSVWELAIQKVRDHKWVAVELTPTMKAYSEAVADITEALRAAAEKEVGTK